MDTDADLATALGLGCALGIVRVRTAATEKEGTRSATAIYEVDVVRTSEPALPAGVRLKHHGPLAMEPGRLYAIAARDSARFHGAWQVCFAAPAGTDDDADHALPMLQARRQRQPDPGPENPE